MYSGTYARYLFYIAVITLALVYYVAVINELPAGSNAFVQIWYAITGRNRAGNYPAYPKV